MKLLTIRGEGRLFDGAPIPDAYFALVVPPQGEANLTLHLRIGKATTAMCNPVIGLKLETHDNLPTAVFKLPVTVPPLAVRTLKAAAAFLSP